MPNKLHSTPPSEPTAMHCLPSSRPHFRLSCADVRKPQHLLPLNPRLLPTTQSNILGRKRNAPPTITSESIGNNFFALVYLLSSRPNRAAVTSSNAARGATRNTPCMNLGLISSPQPFCGKATPNQLHPTDEELPETPSWAFVVRACQPHAVALDPHRRIQLEHGPPRGHRHQNVAHDPPRRDNCLRGTV